MGFLVRRFQHWFQHAAGFSLQVLRNLRCRTHDHNRQSRRCSPAMLSEHQWTAFSRDSKENEHFWHIIRSWNPMLWSTCVLFSVRILFQNGCFLNADFETLQIFTLFSIHHFYPKKIKSGLWATIWWLPSGTLQKNNMHQGVLKPTPFGHQSGTQWHAAPGLQVIVPNQGQFQTCLPRVLDSAKLHLRN